MKVFRKVRTCADREATRKKRAEEAGRILNSLDRGLFGIDHIFWTDECWVDTTGNRFSPQNNRVYAMPGVEKSDPSMRSILSAPQKQRTPGVMVRLTVTSSRNGTAFTPHLIPIKTYITGEYYTKNIIENDVLPKIRAHVLGSDDPGAAERWVFTHDLASSHTAAATTAFLRQQKVRTLPWAPMCADINPLDIFAWDSIKCEIQKIPAGNRNIQVKLQAALTKVMADLAGNEDWRAKLVRTCRGVPDRLRWVSRNSGEQIMGRFRDNAA